PRGSRVATESIRAGTPRRSSTSTLAAHNPDRETSPPSSNRSPPATAPSGPHQETPTMPALQQAQQTGSHLLLGRCDASCSVLLGVVERYRGDPTSDFRVAACSRNHRHVVGMRDAQEKPVVSKWRIRWLQLH